MFERFLIFAVLLSLSFASFAGLTEDDLEKFKTVLPKGLTPKNIADWSKRITYKNTDYTLHVWAARPRLRMRYYSKLEKKGKVLIRIVGSLSSDGGLKRYYKGAVNIYLYSVGDTVELAAHKKVKLAKLCPT